MRLIDADEVIKRINEEIFWTDSAKASVRNKIYTTPTISLESLPPQGKWIFSNKSDWYFQIWKCSNCGKEWELHYDPRKDGTRLKHCPECGARMNTTGGEL